ncbi:MAG: PAS domain S-box protein [Alphaproteobacteria bacterium]|nr:PAS domain S-box protein [Alphaproteobacteria bacterium]
MSLDRSVCDILARLAAAGTAREVAACLHGWVEEGRLRAFALWTLDNDTGPLRSLHAEGIDAAVSEWNVLPHDARSPLWRALDSGEGLLPAPMRADLAREGVEHWDIHVLRSPAGERLGVVLCGCPTAGVPEGTRIVLGALGAALARARRADADAVRSGLFAHVAELVSDGLIVATPDGAVPVYNPALARLTGWSPDDVRTHGWTNLVYPDPVVREDLQRGIVALMRGTPSEGIVRTLARKDGTEVSAAIWSRLVPHPSGFAPAMLGVFRDATGERLARKRAIWEESHAQLGKLAGGIAHEFNNLLAAIMGHADLVALRSDDPQVRSHAETILRSAERGADLSTQLLAFSGSGNTKTRAVSVATIVEQAAALFAPRVPPDVAFDHAIDASLPPVEADPGQLQQVLMNLLSNAIDAVGRRGAVAVSADLVPIPETARYRSPYATDDRTVRLRVRDDGPGFTADALANLFVPFFSGKDHGHGVGLPAVRGIVGAHGGAIDVSNDGGAIVDVYLPVSTRPELELPELLRDASGRGERIWIVDDQPAVLEFSRISLEAHGFDVRSFDGVPALRAALAALAPGAAPTVVVLDVVMPDGGGAAAWDALSTAGLYPRVVWTSGHTPDDVTLPEEGVFLQKPYTGADLAVVVHRLAGAGSR